MESGKPDLVIFNCFFFLFASDAGVVTDPPVKVKLSDQECQTSKQDVTDR